MTANKTGAGKNPIDESAVWRRQIASLGRSDDLRKSFLLLSAAMESATDGILIADNKGKVLIYNSHFLSLWGIPETVASVAEDRQLLLHVMNQLNHPEVLMKKMEQLYKQPKAESIDTLALKDGRVLEALSKPYIIDGKIIGRIWSFRDVTQFDQGAKEHNSNRKLAERLAKEMSVIAKIGRLIGSTLDINEVYEKFAVEAGKLISFDRLSVSLINPDLDTFEESYVSGLDIPDLKRGRNYSMEGSITGALRHNRKGRGLMILHPASAQKLASDSYIHLYNAFQAGIRSFMSVPLISRDAVIGALHFRSKKPNAYTEQDLQLAEMIAEQISGAIANAQLYADLKRTENAMRESEGRFRALVEQAAVGVAMAENPTRRYCMVNRRFCELVGRTEDEMLAITSHAITHPDDLHLHDSMHAKLLAGKIGNYALEKRYVRKDGKIIWVNVTVSPLAKPGEAIDRHIVVVQDITQRKQMEYEIREMSLRDGLTGLYNRRGFVTLAEQQLRVARRAKRQMQLFFTDVDGLKWINDNLGHKEGDKALIEATNILRKTFRESDIIARLGGDEFAVLTIDMADLNPEAFAHRLQQHIDECNAKQPRRYRLAMSWGASRYDPESPSTLNHLMSLADKLMYAQKKAKKEK